MAAIKATNTKPELWLRQRLHRLGYRYTLSNRNLPGKPDIVLPRYKKAIFVHGCFWHMHNCPLFVLPKSRTEFWADKLSKNVVRDQRVLRELAASGWGVLYVWECAIRGRLRLSEATLMKLVTDWLEEGYANMEITGTY